MRRLLVPLAVVVLVVVSAAPAQEMLRYETKDWVFIAPPALGTQADLELNGRQVQLCHDEVVALTGHRPRTPAKFTVEWVIDEKTWYSRAGPSGWVNSVPSTFRLVDESSRSFREEIVRRGVCFGPHEVTHVLTAEGWPPAWANEGLATFTDRLYDNANWKCCTQPSPNQTCDATGYWLHGQHYAYSDLSEFRIDFASYSTAACFWIEINRRAGLPAIRGILAGMRYQLPRTTGELVTHHANRVLNADLRPVVARYGFEPAELEAGPVPSIPGCTLIGMGVADAITGTPGPDTICGLGGADRLTGGAGADILEGGSGNDVLNARDGRRDVVRGGPGHDTAQIDRGLDRVTGVERIKP